ncbi:hypothetical protein NIES2107_34750 [Nostoc carneum NIES-2107]|nr:hypothetical protein NIES2107_34750 [Nostoc carneum NIES-2107]
MLVKGEGGKGKKIPEWDLHSALSTQLIMGKTCFPCPMPIFNTGLKLVERVELSLAVLTLLVYRVRTGVIGDQLCDV